MFFLSNDRTKEIKILDSLPLALTNLTSPAVLAFVLGLLVVAVRSHLQIPAQVYEVLSIFLLLAIGLKGGVALRGAEFSEIMMPIALAVAFGLLIPLAVYFVLKATTRLDSINRGALAAHYGSTSLVTFTAGLVFVEQSGLVVEAYLFTLLAVMEVPGIIIGIFLAKRAAMRGAFGPLMHEVFTGKSVVLLIGGMAIGAATGATGYEQVQPLFGGLFAGVLTLFLLQLGIQAGQSIKDVRSAGFGLILFSLAFPLVVGSAGVAAAQAIGISEGGSVVFGLLCGSASYIAAPAAVKLSLPEAKPGLYITTSLGITFPMNLLVGIPFLAWVASAI